jgi:hypothetical protein
MLPVSRAMFVKRSQAAKLLSCSRSKYRSVLLLVYGKKSNINKTMNDIDGHQSVADQPSTTSYYLDLNGNFSLSNKYPSRRLYLYSLGKRRMLKLTFQPTENRSRLDRWTGLVLDTRPHFTGKQFFQQRRHRIDNVRVGHHSPKALCPSGI